MKGELSMEEKLSQVLTESAGLGFELAHVGINCADEVTANSVAGLFGTAFGFDIKAGKSSIFCSSGIEVMKTQYFGEKGHIAIRTNSISQAINYLQSRGFETDPGSSKYDEDKKLIAIYLKQDFGGFAVHLLQKK